MQIYNFEYYPSKPGIVPKLITYYHLLRIWMLKNHHPRAAQDILAHAIQNKKLIIQVMYGGLGDHLIYSSLPRLLFENYDIKTYISNKSLYRSPEIRKFVWESNPYITFTDEKGWSLQGSTITTENKTLDKVLQEIFGLECDGTPEVFHKSNKVNEVAGKTIVDVSFGPSGKIAYKYHTEQFATALVHYLKRNTPDFILITHDADGYSSEILEDIVKKEFNPPSLGVATIEELSNALYSAKERYLLFSGGASLAASLSLPSNILCNKKMDQRFVYRTNTYIDITK